METQTRGTAYVQEVSDTGIICPDAILTSLACWAVSSLRPVDIPLYIYGTN